jgi:hypothetical protein
MRALIVIMLAGIGMTALNDAADAADYYRYRGKFYRVTKACDHTCVRARSLDPAGTYRAYPDWARAALSPKAGGRSRF